VVQCPECTSQKVWKDGIRYVGKGRIQRFLCRSCGHRFSDGKVKVDVVKQGRVLSDSVHDFGDLNLVNGAAGDVGFQDSAFTVGKDVGSHDVPIVGKTINSFLPNSREHRVCASETKAAKNLVEVESRIEKRAAGATKLDEATVKGKIVELAWWMKKNGYAETTIRLNTTVLRVLSERGADIFNPESVKEIIAKQKWSEARRHSAIAAYTLFLKMLGQTWNPPICKVTRKLPFIPTEQEIDALIAGCGNKTATFLQLLKETAMRAGEANSLLWTNVDFERRTITLNKPEKGGNARIFNVSNKMIGMLNALPKTSLRIFGKSPTSFRKSAFYQTRKILAKKLQNHRLQRISFHTLRHWKATTLYHQTKDILYVKQFLGHRKVETTLLYIQLAEAIFKEATDEFTVRVATEPDEIKALLEVGFEFVCEKDGLLYFRKRK
jgi:integrase